MENKEKVLNNLKDTGIPMKAAEIAKATGIDAKEVAKAIKQLKTDGLIDSPKFCYYAPVK